MVRKSNFELLRIISMMMVVGLHYFNRSMGGALGEQQPTEGNYYITYLMESLFIVGVNCFILITGYFQIGKSKIRLIKVLELLLIMMFYGVLFYSAAVAFGWTTFSLKGMLIEVLPIFAGLKWFIKVYIVLYLLIPFINKGLNAMEKKEFQRFLLVSLGLFSFYPSFLPSPPVTDRGYGIITFILVYSIGGYLKKYYTFDKSKYFYLNGYFLCTIITFAFAVGVSAVFGGGLGIVWGYNFLFNVFGSVFLFLFFSKIEIQSKFINYIASFSLGVYFVHTSPVIYDFLYGSFLQTHRFWHSPWFTFHALSSIVVVYFIATLIDILRKRLFDFVSKKATPYFRKSSAKSEMKSI